MIDEVTDPPEYEWTRIPNGGIFFTQDELDPRAYGAGEHTERHRPLWVNLSDQAWEVLEDLERNWRRLDHSEKGDGKIAHGITPTSDLEGVFQQPVN